MITEPGTKNIRNALTERMAVSAISLLWSNIGWIFRERGNNDYGIDADVEQMIMNNGEPRLTNRHIAVQIKGGGTQLSELSDGKHYFYMDQRIANYWLSSDRPVVIMVHDTRNCTDEDKRLCNGKIFWTQINRAKLITTDDGYKITVDNEIDVVNEDYTRLNDIFTSIIDTYIPEYYAKEELSGLTCFDSSLFTDMWERFSDVLSATQKSLESVVVSICTNTEDLENYSDRDWAQRLEFFLTELKYYRNIIDLYLFETCSYFSSVRDIQRQWGINEFDTFFAKTETANVDAFEQLVSLLGHVKMDLYDLSQQNGRETVLKQALVRCISVIEDFIAIVSKHLAEIKGKK